MKNKLFNAIILTLFLSVAVMSTPSIAMESSQDECGLFGKGNRGFLFQSAKEKKSSRQKASPLVMTSNTIPTDEGIITNDYPSIWLDPRYQGKDALETVYKRMNLGFREKLRSGKEYVYPTLQERDVPEEILSSQSNVTLLFAALTKTEDEPHEISGLARALGCLPNVNDIRKAALNNRDLLNSYFLIKALSNTKYVNEQWRFWSPNDKSLTDHLVKECPLIPKDQDANRPILTFQVLDNLILFSMFEYMSPLADGFITPGSDAVKGQLNVIASCWPGQLIPFPKIFYYKENVDRMSLYRIYFEEQSLYVSDETEGRQSYDGIHHLPESSAFKGYQFTQLHACVEFAWCRDNVSYSGYILNKDGTLLQNNGIAVLTRSGRFKAYSYDLNKSIGQHSFTSSFPFLTEDELFTSPYMEALMTLAGGIERVKREELVFLPHQITKTEEQPTYDEAAFLLPYLYKLREIDGTNDHLTRAILRIENVLTDAQYEEKNEMIMNEVEQDIDAQIEKEIEQGDPETCVEIDAKATQIYIAYKRPERKKNWGAESKRARDLAKQQLKEERKTTRLSSLTEEEKIRLKKERILEKIRQSYLAKTRDRKHFDSMEVDDILAGMRRAFSKVQVMETGVSVTHGSHTGLEMKTMDGSVKLGTAKRPQDEGYKAGTVRTIINDHVDRILSLVLS